MESLHTLEKITKDLKLLICSFLDVKDIMNIVSSARIFTLLLNEETLWRDQIKNYVPINLITELEVPNGSARDNFRAIYKTYTQIRKWLEGILNKIAHDDFRGFLEDNYWNNKISRREVETTIIDHYQKIPLEYYILYRFLNGQEALKESLPDEVALFGGFTYYDRLFDFPFLPLRKPENHPILQKFNLHTISIPTYINTIKVFVDFNNVFGKGRGTLCSFIGRRLEKGKEQYRIFIMKRNISTWLHDLQFATFSEEKGLLDHFDTLYHPQSDITTRGIRVRNDSIYSIWDHGYNGNLFTYQIRISANGVQGRWKLTTRHWIISDGGESHEVKGSGVIGFYPEIYEGCEDFCYESCSPIQGLSGSMKGFFYFRNMDSSEEIAVEVGEMKFEFPSGCALIDFCPEDRSVTTLYDKLSENRH